MPDGPPVSGFPNSRRSFTTRSDDSPAREPAQHRPSWNARGVTTGQRLGVDADDLRRVLLGDHITGAKGYPPILDEVEAAIVSAELGNQPRLPRSRTPVGSTLRGCAADLLQRVRHEDDDCTWMVPLLRRSRRCGRVSIEATAWRCTSCPRARPGGLQPVSDDTEKRAASSVPPAEFA